MSYTKKVYKDSLTFGIGNILSRLIIVFLLPFYTRVLSVEDFGIFSLLLIYFNVVSIVARFGVANVMLKYYVEEKSVEEKRLITGTAVSYLVLINFALLILIMLFSSKVSFFVLKMNQGMLITLFTLNAFLEAIEGNFVSIMTAEGRWKLYAAASLTYAVLVVILSAIGIYCFKSGIAGLSLALLIAKAVMFAISYFGVRDCIKISFRKKYISKYFHLGKHLILASLYFWVINMSDKLFLNYMHTTEDVAILSVANRISSIVQLFVFIPFSMIWNQMSIRIYSENDAGKIYGRIFSHLLFLLSVISLTVILFSREIVLILTTKAYANAWIPSAVMTIGMSLYTLYYFYSFYPTVIEKTGILSWLSFVAMIINVLSNYFIVKAFGFYGASLTNLFTYLFLFVGIYVYINKKLLIEYPRKKIALIVAVFCFASLFSVLPTKYILLKVATYAAAVFLSVKIVGGVKMIWRQLEKIKKKTDRSE